MSVEAAEALASGFMWGMFWLGGGLFFLGFWLSHLLAGDTWTVNLNHKKAT